jgi:hypothetical protein
VVGFAALGFFVSIAWLEEKFGLVTLVIQALGWTVAAIYVLMTAVTVFCVGYVLKKRNWEEFFEMLFLLAMLIVCAWWFAS